MNILEEIRQVQQEADLLFSEQQVEQAIDQLARDITARLGDTNPVILTVLNGGIIFCGRLLTKLDFPLQLDSVQASRYRGATEGGQIEWQHKPTTDLQGRTVLITDDILDEGITLSAVQSWCQAQGAAAIYIAVLVDKHIGRGKPCKADFVGLEVENRYLFGYGLDYKNYLRNAAGIYACRGL